MRRNNLMNDKVLRALTIGLTAMIAVTSTPMTVFADEINPDEGSGSENSGSDSSDSQEESAPTTESVASEAENTVVDSVDSAPDCDQESQQPEATAAGEMADKLDESVDIAQETGADKLEANVQPSADAAAAAKDNLAESQKNVDAAEANLNEAVKAEASIKENADKANSDVEEAAKVVAKSEDISNDAAAKEQEYLDQINEKINQIENAGSLESAQALRDAAVAIVGEAQGEYAKALEEYDSAVSEYETIKKDYETALAALLEAEQAYTDAVGLASGNIEDAIAKLDAAIENERTLKREATIAYEKMNTDAGILMDAAEKATIDQVGVNENNGQFSIKNEKEYWKAMDKMFDVMVRQYYIPVYLGYGSDVIIKAKSVDSTNQGFEKINNFSVFNYKLFEVQDANGEKLADLYLNYKREGQDPITMTADGKKMLGMYIFEKDDYLSTYVSYKSSDGKTTINMLLSDFNTAVNNGEINVKEYNDKVYVINSDNSISEAYIPNGYDKDKTDKSETFTVSGTNLIQKITYTETTVNKTGNKLGTVEAGTEQEAKDVVRALINDEEISKMKQNSSLKYELDESSDISVEACEYKVEASCTATVNYQYIFTDTIDINKDSQVGDVVKTEKGWYYVASKDDATSDTDAAVVKAEASKLEEKSTNKWVVVNKGGNNPNGHNKQVYDTWEAAHNACSNDNWSVQPKPFDEDEIKKLESEGFILVGVDETTGKSLFLKVKSGSEPVDGVGEYSNGESASSDKTDAISQAKLAAENNAKEKVEEAIKEIAKKEGKNALVYKEDINFSDILSSATATKFSYNAEYTINKIRISSKTATWREKTELTGFANLEYLKGLTGDEDKSHTLAEDDENLRKFIENSVNTKKELGEISKEGGKADTTIAQLTKSLDNLKNLKKQIDDLKSKYNVETLADLGIMTSELEKKIADLDKVVKDDQLDEAKKILDEIIDKLDDIEDAYEDTVDRLTPSGDDTPAPTGETPYVAPILPISTPTFPAGPIAIPDAGVAGARREIGGGIDNGAEELIGGARKLKKIADDKDALDLKEISKLTRIEDEEVALAAIPGEVNKNMNWWWLLIVALLGATGYELYKKHEEKKQEAEANKEN